MPYYPNLLNIAIDYNVGACMTAVKIMLGLDKYELDSIGLYNLMLNNLSNF